MISIEWSYMLNLFDPLVFLGMLFGMVWGIFNGALPGFGGSTSIALLLPFTFGVDPVFVLPALASAYMGSVYGGSISAITLGIPGTSGSIATIYDGYEMSKKGLSRKALHASVVASTVGGMFGAAVLLFTAPALARVGLMFGPPEYFLLAIFGISIIASLSGKSILLGVMGGLIGLFMSTVGMDPVRGTIRFSFGFPYLYDGVPMLPAILGIFAFPMCLLLVKKIFKQGRDSAISTSSALNSGVNDRLSLREFLATWKTILRSSIIGTIVGIIPAAGTDTAAFIGYSEAKRNSKEPSKFGTGIIEGVVASEAANNAVCGGSLVPMLTLGIPGNAVSAVLMGALTMQGLVPGFQLFTKHAEPTYTFIFSLFFSTIIMLLIGWYGGQFFSNITKIPISILAPTILLISLAGAFISRQYMFDVAVTAVIGIAAYFLTQTSFPMSTILLGFILGPIAESGFMRAMQISRWDFTIFFTRPLSIFLIVLTILSLITGIYMSKPRKYNSNKIKNN